MKPTLKAPESRRWKLEYEKTLPNFAFKFNLRRSIKVIKDTLSAFQAVPHTLHCLTRPPLFNPT